MQEARIVHPLMGLHLALREQTIHLNDSLRLTHKKAVHHHALAYPLVADPHPLITLHP